MRRRYRIGDFIYLYEEGTQPEGAELVEPKKVAKAEPKKVEDPSVDTKITIPKNKSKGVKAK